MKTSFRAKRLLYSSFRLERSGMEKSPTIKQLLSLQEIYSPWRMLSLRSGLDFTSLRSK